MEIRGGKWGPKLFLPVVLVKILKKYTNLLARDLNFINKIRGKRVYLKHNGQKQFWPPLLNVGMGGLVSVHIITQRDHKIYFNCH
jgi:hypothetical protein